MNEIFIKAHIPIDLSGLAHQLGLCEFPETIFGMLGDNPRRAEKLVRDIAEEFIGDAEAKVTIKTIEYSHIDSPNIKHAVVYFIAVLSGTASELTKVVGHGKLFSTIKE